VKFSTDPNDYLPVVLSRWEGMECYNYSALVYAKDKKNIAITGKGILDGCASSENWWPWKGKKEYGFVEGMPSQLDSLNRAGLQVMNIEQVPTEERIFGDGHYLRPNFVQLINCENILIEGVTFKDSPMWFLHPILSENITIRGITVVGKGPNNDGLDPESCKNVLIEDCFFDTGDDCIAIKSGRNEDGRRINVPSENFVIRNCKMLDGHGGVVIGSEISGGCRNIYAENCVMDSPNLDRAIRIKTNTIRGGVVENIFVRNITVGEVKEAILKINLKYEPKEIGVREFPPTVRNVYLSNVTSKKSKYGLYLDGLPQSLIQNIYIEDSRFDGVEDQNFIRDIENLNVSDVYINNEIYKN
jgi:polygalacturonase